jgi:DedD protein
MPQTNDPVLDDLKRRARRRLVGAIVLALAAAVVVPMLLESEPRPLGGDVSVKIPPVDDGRFVNRLNAPAPAAPEPPAAQSAPPVATSASAAPGATAEDDAPADTAGDSATPQSALADAEQRVLGSAPAKSADTKSAPPAAAPPPAKSADAKSAPPAPKAASARVAAPNAAAKETYVVQLAAFTDDKGAGALAAKLKKAGYPAYTEPVTTSQGKLWRVRVGPYASREDANNARDRLKREGQNGIVSASQRDA